MFVTWSRACRRRVGAQSINGMPTSRTSEIVLVNTSQSGPIFAREVSIHCSAVVHSYLLPSTEAFEIGAWNIHRTIMYNGSTYGRG
jgi:hypothetical protein